MYNLKSIKDSVDIVLKRKTKTGSKTVFMCDYANKTDFNVKSDAVYSTGKGVRKVMFQKAPEGSFKLEVTNC